MWKGKGSFATKKHAAKETPDKDPVQQERSLLRSILSLDASKGQFSLDSLFEFLKTKDRIKSVSNI